MDLLRRISARYTRLQLVVHLAAWLLAAWLIWDAATNNLTINPIQAATQRTGRYALYFLVLSLACTPLNTFFGLRQAIKVRRSLGLYAAIFAGAHFLLFIGLDYGFDLPLIVAEIAYRNYILVGMSAGLILAVLAFTSSKYWQKRLGKNWKRLHRLVYLAGILVVIHYAWATKGDLLRLQGNILQPLALGLTVLLLLAARLPVMRRAIGKLRARTTRLVQT